MQETFYMKKTYYSNYVKNTFLPLNRIENNIRNKTGIKNIGKNDKKLLNNRIRTQGNFIRKAINNFKYSKKITFLTLTYKENIQDVKKAKLHLQRFFKAINYYRSKYKKLSNFKWCYVYEYQKRGAIHFHIILDCYIPNKVIRKCWPYGINKNIRVKKDTNEKLIKYLSKYMIKSLTGSENKKIAVCKENNINYETKNIAVGNKLNNLYDLNVRAFYFSNNCQNVISKNGIITISLQDLINVVMINGFEY